MKNRYLPMTKQAAMANTMHQKLRYAALTKRCRSSAGMVILRISRLRNITAMHDAGLMTY